MGDKMNKKGISPIIATMVLLVIAIGLGVIAMNWGRAYLETSSTCAIDTGMDIVTINDIPQICYMSGEEGYISFLVENGPNIDIEKIQLRAIGKKTIYTTELEDSKLPIGGTYQAIVPYNSVLFGSLRQVKITPEILLYEGQPPAICPEQGLIIENIGMCR